MARIRTEPGRPIDNPWPELATSDWRDTRDTLHLWTQIIGKLKVELAPFQNQLWHTALGLTARGLTTGPLPYHPGALQADFDFLAHQLVLQTSAGGIKSIPLYSRSVASFYDEVFASLRALGVEVEIDPVSQELPQPIRCDLDTTNDSYDPDAVQRWWTILQSSAKVMWRQRSFFTGKASPVHFFWGGFDLTATRHSGRTAPVKPDSGYIYRVAENEENWAAGFWPGSGAVTDAAYYAYMVPKPAGYEEAQIAPSAAFWSVELGEFVLPYDAVRTAPDPDAMLWDFLQSTYAAGADLARWDRERLEIGTLPEPR